MANIDDWDTMVDTKYAWPILSTRAVDKENELCFLFNLMQHQGLDVYDAGDPAYDGWPGRRSHHQHCMQFVIFW
jgi:hypothetical protein